MKSGQIVTIFALIATVSAFADSPAVQNTNTEADCKAKVAQASGEFMSALLTAQDTLAPRFKEQQSKLLGLLRSMKDADPSFSNALASYKSVEDRTKVGATTFGADMERSSARAQAEDKFAPAVQAALDAKKPGQSKSVIDQFLDGYCQSGSIQANDYRKGDNSNYVTVDISKPLPKSDLGQMFMRTCTLASAPGEPEVKFSLWSPFAGALDACVETSFNGAADHVITPKACGDLDLTTGKIMTSNFGDSFKSIPREIKTLDEALEVDGKGSHMATPLSVSGDNLKLSVYTSRTIPQDCNKFVGTQTQSNSYSVVDVLAGKHIPSIAEAPFAASANSTAHGAR